MSKWLCWIFTPLVVICNVIGFFPLQNSMFSKGCIQVHMPNATNTSNFRMTSFCSPKQSAFSALCLSLPFCRHRITMLIYFNTIGLPISNAIQICGVRPFEGSLQTILKASIVDLFIAQMADCTRLSLKTQINFVLHIFMSMVFLATCRYIYFILLC